MVIDDVSGDLLLEGGRLSVGRSETTIAGIVTTANRGELKELPLIGGEAERQLGSPRQGMWLTRLRKHLTAVGLRVRSLSVDSDLKSVQMEVE